MSAAPGAARETGPLNRGWRLIATAIAFSTFGAGGLVLGVTVFPVLMLITRDADTLRCRSQHTVSLAFAAFVWWMKTLGLLSYEIRGREYLQAPGQLIIANHPSLIDVVFLISLVRQIDCVIKQPLLHNPFTRWATRSAGYIGNSESAQLVDQCSAVLHRGRSLLIFPEGTRTVPGQPIRLQRGTANIALRAVDEIRPVLIRCAPSTLTKAEPWYVIPRRKPHWIIDVREPFALAPFRADDRPTPAAARQLTRHIEQYFSRGVDNLTTPASPDGARATGPIG